MHRRMLVFRSLAIGLSAACFALLVMRPTVELRVTDTSSAATVTPAYAPAARQLAWSSRAEPAPRKPRIASRAPRPTIIDVAPGITATQLAATLHLRSGERIVSVDDVAVADNVAAGVALASRDLGAQRFIDVGVAGPGGERRIIVLMH